MARIEFKGKEINLTEKELELFNLLKESGGKVVTRETMLKKIWGMEPEQQFVNSIEVLIFYLRKKIGKHSIKCVPKKGYVLV